MIMPHEKRTDSETGGACTDDGDDGGGDDGGEWEALAGSGAVRALLEESLLLPLMHPEVYQEVMRGTRRRHVAPHAKAVLLEGPPGCGKTSAARILAKQLGRPFVPLPLESLVSKWYQPEQLTPTPSAAPIP